MEQEQEQQQQVHSWAPFNLKAKHDQGEPRKDQKQTRDRRLLAGNSGRSLPSPLVQVPLPSYLQSSTEAPTEAARLVPSSAFLLAKSQLSGRKRATSSAQSNKSKTGPILAHTLLASSGLSMKENENEKESHRWAFSSAHWWCNDKSTRAMFPAGSISALLVPERVSRLVEHLSRCCHREGLLEPKKTML